jgi:hypothetical protein
MDLGSLTAEAGGAGVVIPAQAEIIHPPNLGGGSDSDIDANRVEVSEAAVEVHRGKRTVIESWASWNSNPLGGHRSGVTGVAIETKTSEMEVAGRALGVTAERRTVHIEAETTSETMIAIADVARVAILESVRSGHGVSAVDVEVGDELCEKRLGRWQVRRIWWRNDDKSIREIELVIRIEYGLWLNVI